jgi:hypothetical protein
MLRKFAVAMVAAGGLMIAAAPAHAGGHVSLSLGVGIPVAGYGYAAPAYYGPPPVVYAPPVPVYAPAPVYYGGYYGPSYYAPRVVYRAGYYGHGWHGHDGWRR